jgi:hypothetical protein
MSWADAGHQSCRAKGRVLDARAKTVTTRLLQIGMAMGQRA